MNKGKFQRPCVRKTWWLLCFSVQIVLWILFDLRLVPHTRYLMKYFLLVEENWSGFRKASVFKNFTSTHAHKLSPPQNLASTFPPQDFQDFLWEFSGSVSDLSLGFRNRRSSWQWVMSARLRLQILKWKLVLLTHLGTLPSWTHQSTAGALGQVSHLERVHSSHRYSGGCTVFSRKNEVAVLWHSSWQPSVGSLSANARDWWW